MDFLKNAAADFQKQQGHGSQQPTNTTTTTQGHSQGGGGLMGALNGAFGGGQTGEQKEDGLDKAIDYVQQNYLKQGDQSNESAIEQMKDEQISDAIRNAYKSSTGKDFFIADKS